MEDYKPKEINSVDEAEASFYCKGSSDKNCLVIDAGSSTLDFALFVHGEKVALSSVQNSSLGASVIEENLYNHFLTDKAFAKGSQEIESAYSVNLHDYFVRVLRERKEKAYEKKQFLKLGSYELLDDLPFIDPKYNSDFCFKLEYDFNLLPSVVTYQEKVHDAIVKAKCEAESLKEMKGQTVDQVLLCGGAALMEWLQDDVREIFSDNVDIQHLDASDLQHDPSFTVADGLVAYLNESKTKFTGSIVTNTNSEYCLNHGEHLIDENIWDIYIKRKFSEDFVISKKVIIYDDEDNIRRQKTIGEKKLLLFEATSKDYDS